MNSIIKAISGLPLTDPVDGGIFIALLLLGAGLVLWGLKKRDVVSLGLALPVVGAAYLLLKHWDVPLHLFLAGLVPVTALISLAHHAGRRVLMATVAVFTSLAVAGLANMEYQSYPTVASLDPSPVTQTISYDQLASYNGREAGAIVTVDLPGTTSGFAARQAIAYLPPAYFAGKDLPVIVLLHGNPGGPEQWFGSGEAAQTANTFQQANGGVSPIVVAVDATGSETANPICVDSSMGNVMTYLSADVPAGIKQAFHVDGDQSHWTVGGLSYGGTCTLQILTNHPEVYGSGIDLSGEAEPTIGKHQDTVAKFFAGSEDAYQAVNPAHLLTTRTYPATEVVFIAGQQDSLATAALSGLSDAARRAGMATYYGTRPGGHSFEVWRPGLREAFAWAARRGGLTDVTDPFDGVQDSDVHL